MYIFGLKRAHLKNLLAIKELSFMTPANYSIPALHVDFLKKQCIFYLIAICISKIKLLLFRLIGLFLFFLSTKIRVFRIEKYS